MTFAANPITQSVAFRARSNLVALKESLAAYFEANGVAAKVMIGLESRNKWDVSRVILIPGKFDGSSLKTLDAGDLTPPMHGASTNPRELVGWDRLVTCSVRAYDIRRTVSEELQIEETESLIEWAIRGIYNAVSRNTGKAIGAGNIVFSSTLWAIPPIQNAIGKEFLFQFVYKSVFFDVPQAVVFPSPALAKGPLNGGVAGANASIWPGAEVTGVYGVSPAMIGWTITFTGNSAPANSGAFKILSYNYMGGGTLTINNANAVLDPNNGSISWSVSP
jgi:hypothetical protein